MRLVCVTQLWWDKYVELCEHRKALISWPTKTALFVAEGDDLVAGVLIYDTTGPYLFFEHLVTNETATLRQRHEAVTMMAKEMVSYCRTVGKFPNLIIRHKGIAQVLQKVGLKSIQAWNMTIPLESLA